MKLHTLVNRSYQAFLKHASDAHIVLLHPRGRYRSLLLARMINDPDLKTLYYAMGPNDLNVPAFLAGIVHDLAGQHVTFGQNLSLAAQSPPTAGMKPYLEAFAADFEQWTDEPFLLILDEYDYSDSADDIQRFVEALVSYLPPHGKLVLNSRTLPRLPWVALIARGQAAILEDDLLVMSDFYGYESGEEGRHLAVNALGPGYVALNDQLITSWEGHLPRLLFFFALDRPTVTRSEICQALWPELKANQAVNVFHVTKRRLHKALGEDILVHDGGYYRVNPALALSYDVMTFVGALAQGRSAQGEEKATHWQRAIEAYQGPFLQGHEDDWIAARRADFRLGYLEAVTHMAELRHEQGHTEHALRLYLKVLEEDAMRQELHRRVMRLFTQMGRRSEAAAHFQRLRQTLAAQGEPLDSQTETTFREIMG